MFRSYSNDVIPERSTLRTVFRDTFRSRAISLIVLPLRKCSRRIRPIVSTVSISPRCRFESKRAAQQAILQGVILDADPPTQGVKIARRITLALDPSYYEASCNRGNILHELGQLEGALAAYA